MRPPPMESTKYLNQSEAETCLQKLVVARKDNAKQYGKPGEKRVFNFVTSLFQILLFVFPLLSPKETNFK